MILETIFYSKTWIICRYWCTNIATVKPDKRVEIKPQNDPTQQCGKYRLRLLLIHQNPLYSFFVNILIFLFILLTAKSQQSGNEWRWYLRENIGTVSDPYWPVRVKPYQWEGHPSEPTRVPDWWTSLVQENSVSSSSIINNNKDTFGCYWVLNPRNNIYMW